MVESDGESYLDNNVPQTRRTASSATPKQTIDKVALVIIRDDNSAEVVYHTTLEGWNDTQNIVSRPYADGSRQGRKAVVTLKKKTCWRMAKTIRFMPSVTKAAHTEVCPLQGCGGRKAVHAHRNRYRAGRGLADEIFAGSRILHVENGEITTAENSPAG